MADLRPQFTEEVVGHGHPTKADVTSRAWNVEHDEDGTHKVLPGESAIIMLFGKAAAPIGWTRKADWQDNAMLCYASAGGIVNGGAVNPQSVHTHTGPSHRHHLPGIAYSSGLDKLLFTEAEMVFEGTCGNYDERLSTTGETAAGQNRIATNLAGTGATGANTAPYYQEVIAATKD